ncbi:hypothetical protein [Novosphingobium sp. Gsoil 351]|uniref:hypothetical protein n=1 Tax=Novosphingobium sp. Gsoil 351 TaxID=2675225 RepID=UPI0012B494BF|nr:hypothetical protein [Novosphingobium sp. Gsoil 351]QGN55797.1 hypothetical protein GKE62_15825 [Novosphingobium sp. Gsoil 351]
MENTPAQVMAPLLDASPSDAGQFVSGLKVVMSRPSDNDVLYTMPGDGTADAATIRFRLSPLDNGSATQVQAFVDVPPITAVVGGKKLMLSEAKVAAEVRDILEALAKNSSSASTHTRLSQVLAALAICTDSKIREEATKLASGSSSPMSRMLDGDSYGEGDEVKAPDDLAPVEDNDPTEFDTPIDESNRYAEDV